MAPAFVCLSIYLSICLPAFLPELLSANSAVHVFRNLLLFVSIFVIRLCLQNVMHSITLKENEHQHNTLEAICVFLFSLSVSTSTSKLSSSSPSSSELPLRRFRRRHSVKIWLSKCGTLWSVSALLYYSTNAPSLSSGVSMVAMILRVIY